MSSHHRHDPAQQLIAAGRLAFGLHHVRHFHADLLQDVGKAQACQLAILESIQGGEGIDGAVDGEFLPLAGQDLLIPAGLAEGASELVRQMGTGAGRLIDGAEPGLPLPVWRNTKWPLCRAPWLVTPAMTGLRNGERAATRSAIPMPLCSSTHGETCRQLPDQG